MSSIPGERNWQKSRKPVTEIIPNCPECGKPGQVVHLKDDIVSMFCVDCRINWKSLTDDCPVCGDSNGYAVPGICAKCYGKRKGVA